MSETDCETPTTDAQPDAILLQTTPETDLQHFDLQVAQLRKQGKSIDVIAAELGCTRDRAYRSIKRTIKTTANALGMSVSRDEMHKRIFGNAPRALGVVVDVMASSKVKADTRLKAASDILDRAGFAPVQRSINVSLIEEMSKEDLVNGIQALLGKLVAQQPVLPTITHTTNSIVDANMGNNQE